MRHDKFPYPFTGVQGWIVMDGPEWRLNLRSAVDKKDRRLVIRTRRSPTRSATTGRAAHMYSRSPGCGVPSGPTRPLMQKLASLGWSRSGRRKPSRNGRRGRSRQDPDHASPTRTRRRGPARCGTPRHTRRSNRWSCPWRGVLAQDEGTIVEFGPLGPPGPVDDRLRSGVYMGHTTSVDEPLALARGNPRRVSRRCRSRALTRKRPPDRALVLHEAGGVDPADPSRGGVVAWAVARLVAERPADHARWLRSRRTIRRVRSTTALK